MRVQHSLTLEEEIIKKLKQIAELEKRSLSFKINEILENYLNNQKGGKK